MNLEVTIKKGEMRGADGIQIEAGWHIISEGSLERRNMKKLSSVGGHSITSSEGVVDGQVSFPEADSIAFCPGAGQDGYDQVLQTFEQLRPFPCCAARSLF